MNMVRRRGCDFEVSDLGKASDLGKVNDLGKACDFGKVSNFGKSSDFKKVSNFRKARDFEKVSDLEKAMYLSFTVADKDKYHHKNQMSRFFFYDNQVLCLYCVD